METKICSKCGRELPLDRFESGRNQCRDCRNARRKEFSNFAKGGTLKSPTNLATDGLISSIGTVQ